MSALPSRDLPEEPQPEQTVQRGQGGPPQLPASYTERVKLTATYLNTIAAGLFIAGIVSPGLAAAYGIVSTGRGLGAEMVIAIGVMVLSLAIHLLA